MIENPVRRPEMVGLPLWGVEKPQSCSCFAVPAACAPQSVRGSNTCFHCVAEPGAVQKGLPHQTGVGYFFVLRGLVRRNSKDLAQRPLFS